MQRRLTLALVGVALASMLFVGAGVLVLAQVGAREQALDEAAERLDFLAGLLSPGGDGDPDRQGRGSPLARALPALGLSDARLAVVDPAGVVRTLEPFEDRRQRPGVRPQAALAILDPAAMDQLAAGELVVLPGGSSEVTVLRAIEDPDPNSGATVTLLVSRPVVTIGRDARVWFLASAVTVLLGAVAASWLLARRFTHPIRRIEHTTAAIAAGDFTARVEVDGNDELSDLGRSVNRMTADLERSKALDQQFLMSVSHDLRTPLTAITGYAEALKDGAVDDPAHTGVVIANHADRLERLVGDLLDLARLDANRFRLQMESLDAGVVVGRAVAGLAPEAERHRLDLEFHKEGPTVVRADPDRLGQTAANLIDNALKFARTRVEVTVSPAGDDAVITVDDDGPGIAGDDLPHVFERLYVSTSQPVRAENPSGMGLAIVRELVTAMSGSVAAGRSPLGGTRMTIRLPLDQQAAGVGGSSG